jgi:hypothetical protein
MWLLLFGSGALLLHLVDWSAGPAAALSRPPPAWAPYALYFLVTALLRLAIRDARLAPLRKKARALTAAPTTTSLGAADFGVGLGKGVASVVVGGDFLGAALAGADLVVKWLLGSRGKRRARVPPGIREAMTRERRRAAVCLLAVGLLCGAQVVQPDLLPRAERHLLALAGIGI